MVIFGVDVCVVVRRCHKCGKSGASLAIEVYDGERLCFNCVPRADVTQIASSMGKTSTSSPSAAAAPAAAAVGGGGGGLKFCTQCGEKSNGNRFCGQCGAPLTN
jgi:hypothetical protein